MQVLKGLLKILGTTMTGSSQLFGILSPSRNHPVYTQKVLIFTCRHTVRFRVRHHCQRETRPAILEPLHPQGVLCHRWQFSFPTFCHDRCGATDRDLCKQTRFSAKHEALVQEKQQKVTPKFHSFALSSREGGMGTMGKIAVEVPS